ncbi:MAG: DUF4229 domain-containing protein [Nocardioidaceae bacterium]
MKEFAVYTLARIGLFLASFVVIAGVWTLSSGTLVVIWPLLIAAVVSAVASYYLLQGPRRRFAARVDERASNIARRFEESRAKEDQD